MQVEPEETAAVITAFALFFCVMAGYFSVRPVRETVSTILGAERTADLFTATWIGSIAIVPIYGALCARFRRSTFLPWIYGFIAAVLLLCSFYFGTDDVSLTAGRVYFVFISVLNLFVVSVFWSFLLELFSPGQARRLFGAIAAGGTAGALLGPLVTSLVGETIGLAGVLQLGAALFVAAIVLQRVLINIGSRGQFAEQPALERPMGGNPFAGFTLVLRSPYLLRIALFVVLLASVNTFLYLTQIRLVAANFPDREQATVIFSRLDTIAQGVTIGLQLLLTGALTRRFGVIVLLTIVPVAMVAALLAFAASGTFAVLAVVMVARRAGEYAFVRPGREMLFSQVGTETKYKAKSLIDVLVYRGGDALSAQSVKTLFGMGWSTGAVAALGAVIALAWAVNGFVLGRISRNKLNSEEASLVRHGHGTESVAASPR